MHPLFDLILEAIEDLTSHREEHDDTHGSRKIVVELNERVGDLALLEVEYV